LREPFLSEGAGLHSDWSLRPLSINIEDNAMKRSFSEVPAVVTMLAFAAAAPHLYAQMSVSLQPSLDSPAAVGELVTWTAKVDGASPGTLWYRFRSRPIGSSARIIKDYGPDNTLDWTQTEHEGTFEVEVFVRNTDTGELASAATQFDMLSRVIGPDPVISATSHPLVFLYSAPPCAPGSRMRVEFRSPEGITQATPSKPCSGDLSMNFYVAGLRRQAEYSVRHIVETGSASIAGPQMTLATADIDLDVPAQTVLQSAQSPVANGLVLQALLFTNPIATDLNGDLVWYYSGNLTFLTRPEQGGYFFALVEDLKGDQSRQVLREFDLTGMTVHETNAARVNEQLVAMGKRTINAFHHEARRLPDGRILTLAGVEQWVTVVEGMDPMNVLGEMIIVLDADLQVVWAWDTFDHLDPMRQATLGDFCANGGGGCPPLYLARSANDWIHGNSVQQTPDGHLLFSMRSQDWVIKIDYNNGNGTGDVLWRLGKDGDFTFNSADPYPWFSHQHDPGFDFGNNTTLTVYDNGNTRHETDPTANSRGQVIQLDENSRTATVLLNVDLGTYSFALGSAQRLPNGNFHFDNGFLTDASSIATEVDSSGKIVYQLKSAAPAYRSFRMRDMYSPP
jgi:arylsulfate sulfotransferase